LLQVDFAAALFTGLLTVLVNAYPCGTFICHEYHMKYKTLIVNTLTLFSVMTADAQLFRTGNSEEKIPFREAMSMKKFIRMVTSRPEKPIWEERQGEPVVHQDQNLAVVWVPVRFYLDQKVLHCGYNLFTLFWNGNTWLITQVSDTETMNCTVDH